MTWKNKERFAKNEKEKKMKNEKVKKKKSVKMNESLFCVTYCVTVQMKMHAGGEGVLNRTPRHPSR